MGCDVLCLIRLARHLQTFNVIIRNVLIDLNVALNRSTKALCHGFVHMLGNSIGEHALIVIKRLVHESCTHVCQKVRGSERIKNPP